MLDTAMLVTYFKIKSSVSDSHINETSDLQMA